MERERIVEGIKAAFAGVTLGKGVSLRQARAIDNSISALDEADLPAWPGADVRDDWSQVSETELLQDNIAHLDDEGLRYYLPAFMLWLLDHYNDESYFLDTPDMARIGTMHRIAPPKEFRESGYAMFDGWTPQQRAAIAAYVEALPRLVELQDEDPPLVERAIRDYWHQFLSED